MALRPAGVVLAEHADQSVLRNACDWGKVALDFTVVNVGEDHAGAWTAQPFSGGLDAGGGEAGLVRDKLLNDGLLPPAN